MRKLRWLFNWLRDQALSYIFVSPFALSVTYPTLFGAVAIVIGYLQDLPWMYIYVGGLASAAFVAVLLNSRAEAKREHSPEHRFYFDGIGYDFDVKDGAIIGLQPFLIFKNAAYFPIQYAIDTDFMSLEGDLGKEYPRDQLQPVLLPEKQITRAFPYFKLTNPIKIGDQETVSSKLHLVYRYGKPGGRLKYHFEIFMNIRCNVKFLGEGQIRWDAAMSYTEPFEHR